MLDVSFQQVEIDNDIIDIDNDKFVHLLNIMSVFIYQRRECQRRVRYTE